ncbi:MULTISPECIES: hypothetical protein [unclassified Brevibacterium]|uniref:hypothetical protein n=1 Tax=unclassified Brevibacterium TaxID=2614124 RepID=UPI001091F253|nr:hypothetical protein [Brevibacterium sp. S22]TGD26480.1 hypothetical protein EB835_19895 [Brevibacterium sp. S22]
MGITDRTNIEVILERPTTILLPGLPPKGDEQVVDCVNLWADGPRTSLFPVREHIGSEADSVRAKKA